MAGSLTLEVIKKAVPRSIRSSISKEMVDRINLISQDPDIGVEFRENILGYADAMSTGTYNIPDYISAVKYVSYKLRGDTNEAAYTKTFPDRVAQYHKNGVDSISPWVASYVRSKLVIEMLGRSMVPTHILNADIHQKAINRLAYLMVNSSSEKVQSDSATSLLTHLKPPETAKIEIDMNVTKVDGIDDLRAATMELVKNQRMAIKAGKSTALDIAHSVIIDGEIEDVA